MYKCINYKPDRSKGMLRGENQVSKIVDFHK